MNERDFCYWLRGYFELTDENDVISLAQTDIIKEHLDLALNKEIVVTHTHVAGEDTRFC